MLKHRQATLTPSTEVEKQPFGTFAGPSDVVARGL